MAWHDIDYSCGHSGREKLYGSASFRQWLADRKSEELCPECWKAEQDRLHKEESEKAKAIAQEYGLPALEGTEKQIQWAESIRKEKIDEMQAEIDKMDDTNIKLALTELSQRIMSNSSAAWWIDNRTCSVGYLLRDAYKEKKADKKAAEDAERLRQVEIETTLRPENPVTEAVAVITLSDNNIIRVEFPEKRDDFRSVVKQYGYSYTYYWHRGGGTNPIDRAAEIGNALLAHNFIVRISDQKIREKVLSGQFDREHTRMIWKRTTGQYEGWFAIQWGRNEDYYEAAKRLPRSRYSKPSVVVPPEYFEEVLDFAKIYDFKLSSRAEEIVKEQQEKKEKMLVVRVEKPELVATGRKVTRGIPRLEVPEKVEIDEGLRDED